MAKKSVIGQFAKALKPRTPEQAMRAPQQRGTVEYRRGQLKGAAAGAGAAGLGAAGLAALDNEDNDEPSKGFAGRMRKATDEALIEENYKPNAVSRANMAQHQEADQVAMPESKGPSFKEAFAAARKRGDDTFSWRGKSYTTEIAGQKRAESKGSDDAGMTSAARAAARGDTDDSDEPRKFAKGGAVRRYNKGGSCMAGSKKYANGGAVSPGASGSKTPSSAARATARGAGAAVRGSRACKMY